MVFCNGGLAGSPTAYSLNYLSIVELVQIDDLCEN